MKKVLLATAMTLAVIVSRETGLAWAQEGAQPSPSTVVKNRAPIDLNAIKVNIPAAKEYMLPNGMHVFVVEDHRSPLVSISVSVRGGSLFESEDKRGVADLVAYTLEEGTKSYSAAQIAALTDKYGASISAIPGSERASVTLSCLSDNIGELLPVLKEMTFDPLFPEADFKRVQFQSAAGASSRQTNPNTVAADALRAALYGESSVYGRPAPTAPQINALTVADLKNFHSKYYVPDTAIIGVAGDVDPKKIVDMLTKVFGTQAKTGGVVPQLPIATFSEKDAKTIPAPIIIDRPGSAQTVLNFGVPGILRNNPDYFPLVLANRVLGGGFNSRLNQKLREEKGYTYGASSSLSVPKWTGTWIAAASVRTPVTTEATRDFVDQFERLQTVPVEAKDFALVKQSIIGNFALTLESPAAILARSIERYEYNLPADYWNTYAEKVNAVTTDDVMRVARKYFGINKDPNAASKPLVWAVAVGEKSTIESGVTEAVTNPPTP